MEQEEIRKLTFAAVANLFLENRRIPLCLCQVLFMIVSSPLHDFSSLFCCQLWSAGTGNIRTLEILPLLHLETAKSAEPWVKTRNNKAKQFNIREGLALVVALSPKRQIIR